ncbi:hypothetical protein [Kitasatospora azatica]|uniref:hypothetical protein n=1 Tax=Kitasatospora azatica TaxID=58347 RepID=UPI000566C970|nr:hypothetical protein [Kitasatospora azatica]
MGEKSDFPEDLVALEEARVLARRDLDWYVRTVEVERRAAYPDPEKVVERCMWPDDLLNRWYGLREAYARAAAAVKAHPLLVQARAEGRLWPVEAQLRGQVPRVEVHRAPGGAERVVVLVDGVAQDTPAGGVVPGQGGVERAAA